MKNIIVTGMSGMMGQRFSQLFGSKYQLHNLDISTGTDITDATSVNNFFKQSNPDAVIHLAAFTNVSAAYEQEGDKSGLCYRLNVQGTDNIINACLEHECYLVHVSTDFVFAGLKSSPYTEEDQPDPIEWYGKTKYMAEQLVQEKMEQAIILRPSYPYSARPIRPDFIALMKQKMEEDTLPPAFTDHIITPTFLDDFCNVYDYCLQNQPSGLYHATGSSWHSDYEIAKMVSDIFELNYQTQPGSLDDYLKTIQRPYQKTLKTSNAKLQKDFGIKIKTMREGLEEIKRQVLS